MNCRLCDSPELSLVWVAFMSYCSAQYPTVIGHLTRLKKTAAKLAQTKRVLVLVSHVIWKRLLDLSEYLYTCKIRCFEAVTWRSKHNTPVSGTGTGRITRTRTRLHGKPIKLEIHRVTPGTICTKMQGLYRVSYTIWTLSEMAEKYISIRFNCLSLTVINILEIFLPLKNGRNLVYFYQNVLVKKYLFKSTCSPVPELSFLPAPYRGWTRAGERRVQDNLHAHAQNSAIFSPQIGGKTIYICYLPGGRSVWEKTVPEVLSTARGRRPRAVLKTKGTVFSHTDRPSPVNNIFIFFLQ